MVSGHSVLLRISQLQHRVISFNFSYQFNVSFVSFKIDELGQLHGRVFLNWLPFSLQEHL